MTYDAKLTLNFSNEGWTMEECLKDGILPPRLCRDYMNIKQQLIENGIKEKVVKNPQFQIVYRFTQLPNKTYSIKSSYSFSKDCSAKSKSFGLELYKLIEESLETKNLC